MTPEERLTCQLCEALEAKLDGGKARIPEAGMLAWQWFCDLSATRTYHAAGPNPIGYAEIEAYARVHRWPLESRHVKLIRALDTVWIQQAFRRSSSAPSGTTPASVTPEMFDAVFG